MRIDQLRIQGIGPFQEEHTFFLGDGCTLIQGDNETGKTSLADAVFGAVYGFPPRPLESGEAVAWVEITFRRGNRSFVLLRECPGNHVVLVETSENGEETLFEGTTENADDAEAYRTRLALILGEGDGGAWSRSGFVKDGELPTRLDGTVRAWLAGQRQGDGETALSRLESELEHVSEDLDSEDGDRGELARIRKARDGKREALAAWSETVCKLSEVRDARDAAKRELAEIPRSTGSEEKDAAYLETLERFGQLVSERERLEESVVSLQEEKDRIRKCIEDEEDAQARLEKDYADILNFPEDLEDLIQRWVVAINRRQELEKELEAADPPGEDAPEPRSAARGILVSLVLGTLTTLLCIGAGAPAVGFILFPVVFGLGLTVTWMQSHNANQLNQTVEEVRIRRAAELDELDGKIKKIKESVKDLGTFESPASLRRQFRGFLAAQEKREQARSLASEQRPLSEVVDGYERTLSELQVVDARTRVMVAEASYLSGMDAKREDLAKELERIRAQRNEPESRRRELTERVEALNAERKRLQADLEEPGRLLDAIADLDHEEAESIRRRTVLTVAVKAFRRALEDEPEDALGLVMERASSLFSRLSLERYDGVRLDGDQDPEVRVGDRWEGLDTLSRRSQDQLWLAIRLAAHEEAGDRALLIVLDEPFSGWDDVRLEQARAIIDGIVGAGRQVILLSADRRLARWTKSVLPLRLPKNGAGDPERRAA
jgi:DNA repair exonuclease SbcCD ATPase subunit